MVRSSEIIDAILLLDNFNEGSQNLYQAFMKAGFNGKTIVLEDDGFLPEGVISIYSYFCGEFTKSERTTGKPRYFNEINVPDYWEIGGTNNSGSVHDKKHERGRIFYAEPKHKRLVKVVDWVDDRGIVRVCDHYNNRGSLYAKTFFNKDGKKYCKTYFDNDGKEILVENYVTKDFILNYDSKTYIYKNKTELALKVIEDLNAMDAKLFYNSLSTPLFISERMTNKKKEDVLLWQEAIRPDIPGNMQIILNGNSKRTSKIYVQNKDSYNKLIELGANKEKLNYLGYYFNFEKKNSYKNESLICTNSDNIEKCKELVEALPNMNFNIMAVTEMSSKLLSLGEYKNVRLYPGAKPAIIDELFDKCDYYLDINHESEIVSAVKQAFLHNHLILCFKNTMHNEKYVAKEHMFESHTDLIDFLNKVMDNKTEIDKHIELQKNKAMFVDIDKYINLLK